MRKQQQQDGRGDLGGEERCFPEKQTATGGETGDESIQRAVSSLSAARLQDRVSRVPHQAIQLWKMLGHIRCQMERSPDIVQLQRRLPHYEAYPA